MRRGRARRRGRFGGLLWDGVIAGANGADFGGGFWGWSFDWVVEFFVIEAKNI